MTDGIIARLMGLAGLSLFPGGFDFADESSRYSGRP